MSIDRRSGTKRRLDTTRRVASRYCGAWEVFAVPCSTFNRVTFSNSKVERHKRAQVDPPSHVLFLSSTSPHCRAVLQLSLTMPKDSSILVDDLPKIPKPQVHITVLVPSQALKSLAYWMRLSGSIEQLKTYCQIVVSVPAITCERLRHIY